MIGRTPEVERAMLDLLEVCLLLLWLAATYLQATAGEWIRRRSDRCELR